MHTLAGATKLSFTLTLQKLMADITETTSMFDTVCDHVIRTSPAGFNQSAVSSDAGSTTVQSVLQGCNN